MNKTRHSVPVKLKVTGLSPAGANCALVLSTLPVCCELKGLPIMWPMMYYAGPVLTRWKGGVSPPNPVELITLPSIDQSTSQGQVVQLWPCGAVTLAWINRACQHTDSLWSVSCFGAGLADVELGGALLLSIPSNHRVNRPAARAQIRPTLVNHSW